MMVARLLLLESNLLKPVTSWIRLHVTVVCWREVLLLLNWWKTYKAMVLTWTKIGTSGKCFICFTSLACAVYSAVVCVSQVTAQAELHNCSQYCWQKYRMHILGQWQLFGTLLVANLKIRLSICLCVLHIRILGTNTPWYWSYQQWWVSDFRTSKTLRIQMRHMS